MKRLLLRHTLCGLISISLCWHTAIAQQTKSLCDFESPQQIQLWEITRGTAQLVAEGATSGKSALQLTFDSKSGNSGAYLTTWRMPPDWSAYDALVLDVLNPNDEPISASVLVGDAAWRDKGGTYWNRHNGGRTFAPGRSEWVMPVHGFFRGEAGSRNNDIKRNIDPGSIVRLDFGFGSRGSTGRVIIDNLRLIKMSAPDGVWAFDFGPTDQALMLGWTPVSNKTSYSRELGYGWGPYGGTPWDGTARDTTFGTMLLQDFCEAGGYNFHIDTPPGRYHVTVYYENSGYWGGEQAQQRTRRILANSHKVWQDDRPDGSAHALYRFENTEPVGVDIWDTYMADELARPAEFAVSVENDGLTLRFEADRAWGSKIAGLIVVREGDTRGMTWLKQQQQTMTREFRGKAVCLDAPAGTVDIPTAWRSKQLIAWPAQIEQDVVPNSLPESLLAAPDQLRIERTVVRGEYESLCVAIRPLADLGMCRIELEPMKGPGQLACQLQSVWYNTSRNFGQIAYHVRPHTLRLKTSLALPANVTRQLIVTASIEPSTPAGQYNGAIVVNGGNGNPILRIPLIIHVRPVTLDRNTDFLMGFFGLMPPGLIPADQRWDALEQTLQLLHRSGMNAVSGGPSWTLTGWQNGQPVIDFGEMDRFFALLKKHGFSAPINGYGGLRFRGVNQGYEIGEVGARVTQQSGLPYDQAIMRAWQAVDAHAHAAGWPTIFYAMCDETRVRDQAERELAFMQIMRKVSAAFPKTIRTSGSYSVNFNARPTDKNDLLYWHQRFFETLDVNSLNSHDPSVMTEAAKHGSAVHIYNQGRTRYSFGLYQWSEYRKGIRARWQWHLNILHGYQFFDLDGREPDTAAICYGRHTLYPTIHLQRCREGAEDFYLYNTLWNRIQQCEKRGAATAACRAAKKLLEEATSQVRLNQREAPGNFDADKFKLKCIAALENLAD